MTVVAIPHWLTETHDLTAAHLLVAHAGELTIDRLEQLLRGRAASHAPASPGGSPRFD
jgi:hypothetical protein